MNSAVPEGWHLIEELTVVTPLGVRFWDPVTDAAVTDELAVTAWPENVPGQVRPARRTPAGIYAFQNLPGLHGVEHPAGEGDAVDSPPSPPEARRFVVEVRDRLRRFLPAAFVVPLPYEGIYPTRPAPGSPPPGAPPGFYLFPAPARPPAAGLACVRGQLVDAATGAPGAHAVLEVRRNGGPARVGIADADGVVLVLFPYPLFEYTRVGSPPVLVGLPPRQQGWDLTVRLRYQPGDLRFTAGSEVPLLPSVLGQRSGLLRPSPSGPAVAEMTARLEFGRELILRTDGLPELLIETGALPP
jgi:hypothetical protein